MQVPRPLVPAPGMALPQEPGSLQQGKEVTPAMPIPLTPATGPSGPSGPAGPIRPSGPTPSRTRPAPSPTGPTRNEIPTRLDAALLRFVAVMYAVQLDQLATLLANNGVPPDQAQDRAREVVERWQATGYADTGKLTRGEPWVWATRRALDALSLRARLVKPSVGRLRHTHAVTDVRLAVERTASWRLGRASWRAERLIRNGQSFAQLGHVPDGEVHWPAGTGRPEAGETWAVEVELSRKAPDRIAAIMTEVLAQAGAGSSPAGIAAPGQRPRYAQLVYVCSPASLHGVLVARAELAPPLAARIEIYDLPESAMRLDTPERQTP